MRIGGTNEETKWAQDYCLRIGFCANDRCAAHSGICRNGL